MLLNKSFPKDQKPEDVEKQIQNELHVKKILLLTFIKNGLYLVIAYILILSATPRMQDNPEFSSHYCSLRFSSWADRPSSSFYINFDSKHLFYLSHGECGKGETVISPTVSLFYFFNCRPSSGNTLERCAFSGFPFGRNGSVSSLRPFPPFLPFGEIMVEWWQHADSPRAALDCSSTCREQLLLDESSAKNMRIYSSLCSAWSISRMTH